MPTGDPMPTGTWPQYWPRMFAGDPNPPFALAQLQPIPGLYPRIDAPGYSGQGYTGGRDVDGNPVNPAFVPATLTLEQPLQARADSDAVLSINSYQPPATMSFNLNMVEVIRITQDGFYYMGEKVEDPHRVYAVFTDWSYRSVGMRSPVTEDDLKGTEPLKLCRKSRYELARKA